MHSLGVCVCGGGDGGGLLATPLKSEKNHTNFFAVIEVRNKACMPSSVLRSPQKRERKKLIYCR